MKPYISNGDIELLKWIGLVLMTLDHINTFLLNSKYPIIFEAGWLVMPLFAFVLAYNLARTPKNEVGYKRVMKRLLMYGLIATPFFVAIHSVLIHSASWHLVSWFPLNILFTLLVSTACIYYLDKDNFAAFMAVFALGGSVVEFLHPAILFTVFSWQYCRSGKKGWLLLTLLMMFPIGILNKSMSGVLSLALIFLVSKIDISIPRAKNFFYAYYPVHLWVVCFFLSDF